MKFTSEDLMKAMGIQVGDRVKTDLGNIFIITQHEEEGIVITNENAGYYSSLEYLVDTEFEILPRPKRVGDLKCTDEIECEYCPLRMSKCTRTKNSTLYKLLEEIKGIAISGNFFDQEIYNLLKARLDKEVQDND